MKVSDGKYITFSTSVIFLLLLIPFFIVIGKVIYLETVKKDFWDQRSKDWTIKKRPVNAKRGNIYAIDSDTGEKLLLATNERYSDVYIDLGKGKTKTKVGRKDTIDWIVPDSIYKRDIKKLCSKLSQMFPNTNRTQDSLLHYFNKQRKKQNRYVLVQKDVSDEQLEQMKRWPIVGRASKNRKNKETKYYLAPAVNVEQKYKRIYPYGDMARRTIGINAKGSTGCDTCYNGIDGYYSRYLSGVHGERWERRINPNQWVPIDVNQEIKVSDGYDIVTTLDVSLQELAEMALLKCLDSNEAESGTVILMETQTGYVKALANFTKQKNGSYYESDNIGAMSRFEPGSTFKMVTAMMLLDKGLVDTSELVPTGRKHYPNTIKDIRDVGKVDHGNVSFTRALELSSNVGISSLVYNLYGKDNTSRARFIDDLHKYFTYEKLDYDLALHEPVPYIAKTTNLDDILRLSFGYVTAMTPLQMLTFYNGIANGGKVMKPMFVSEVLQNGQTIRSFSPVVLKEQMCQPSTLAKIQDILKRVVLYGTGRRLRGTAYGIAGKSGTAEIGYEDATKVLRHRASFVGYFPADEPKYSCIVVISKPHKALTHGGDLAAPVFRELSDRVVGSGLASYNIKDEKRKEIQPLLSYGHSGQYYSLCRNLGFILPRFSDTWIRTFMDDSIFHGKTEKIENGIMPEVRGLTLRDAVYMLESLGLKVNFSGYGRVVEQSMPKGKAIEKGQTVYITTSSERERKKKMEESQIKKDSEQKIVEQNKEAKTENKAKEEIKPKDKKSESNNKKTEPQKKNSKR